MFSDINQTIADINIYTFMGVYTEFWRNLEHFPCHERAFYVLLVWISLLFRKKTISLKLSRITIKSS